MLTPMGHPPEPRRARLTALSLAILVAACSGPVATPATASPSAQESDMAGFVLSSPTFPEGGAIPTKNTCDGQDVSPALVWEGAPAATATLALIVDDPDARGFIHWVVYNIPGGETGGLPEGAGAAANPPQGRNDFGRVGWGGPCPPSGTHRYRFTLYALSGSLTFAATPTAGEVRNAVARVLLGHSILNAKYTRKK
jgi:Raf kinase inhibitor-like YbhB/YbcL family protein